MSQITIDARDARLAILGYQPEVTRIYWSALPEKLPTYGQTLDLSGCEITAIYVDGSEAVVTPYCTFSPDTGATVPNAKTMTITATYTARSGKVCEADETLPICVPSYIRIIVPSSVGVVKERTIYRPASEPLTWNKYSAFFGFSDVYACLYWERDSEVVAITKVPAVFGEGSGMWDIATPGYHGIGIGHNISAQTYNRYFTPTLVEEVHADYAFQITASYSLYGINFSASAYLAADIVDSMKLTKVPTTYTEDKTVTLTNEKNVRVFYKSGTAELCSITETGAGFYDSNQTPPYYSIQNITIGEGRSGSFNLAFSTRPSGQVLTSVSFNCQDGAVTWSPEGVII